jgi:hypothetical protein
MNARHLTSGITGRANGIAIHVSLASRAPVHAFVGRLYHDNTQPLFLGFTDRYHCLNPGAFANRSKIGGDIFAPPKLFLAFNA